MSTKILDEETFIDQNNNIEQDQSSDKKNTVHPRALLFKLSQSIKLKYLQKFEQIISRPENGQMGKTVINEILLKCIENAALTEKPDRNDGVDFIECFMRKTYMQSCYFVCWNCTTCRKIVEIYLAQKRKFTHYSIGFLLRCNDIDLINKYLDSELVGEEFCSNWHIMFFTSYREKFYSDCLDRSREGFLCRFILLCRLRCSLENKRLFLIWFAGLIYLYTDEYFYRSDQSHIKTIILILFDALMLNGILTYNEMKNFFELLVNRNEYIKNLFENCRNPDSLGNSNADYNNKNNESQQNTQKVFIPDMSHFYSIYTKKYPFTLKNLCRIVIKNSMRKYTRKNIEKLTLPTTVKRFLYYEPEIEKTMSEVLNENYSSNCYIDDE
jgi:hypothetical protein